MYLEEIKWRGYQRSLESQDLDLDSRCHGIKYQANSDSFMLFLVYIILLILEINKYVIYIILKY